MKEGDFQRFVAQYEKLVYTICYQLARNHHTAQDLSQETFLAAYTHMGSCPAGAEKPWLARIAANKAKDFLKSAYNRKILSMGEEGVPEGGSLLYMQAELPEEIAIGREAAARIEADIRALKEPYHRVAVLFFIEEYSVEEIARRLQRPPKTVHTQLYRAKNLLRAALAETGPPGAGGTPASQRRQADGIV